MRWQQAIQAASLAKLFLFFLVPSSLRPPVFVCADIVLAGLYFCSPPLIFPPVIYVELTLTPILFCNVLFLPPELMLDRVAPNVYTVQFVRSTLKVEQVLAPVYRLIVLEKSSGLMV